MCTIEEADVTGSAFYVVSAMAEAGIDSEPATVATDPRVATCDQLKPAGQRVAKEKEACFDPCWFCVETACLICWQSCHYPLELHHNDHICRECWMVL